MTEALGAVVKHNIYLLQLLWSLLKKKLKGYLPILYLNVKADMHKSKTSDTSFISSSPAYQNKKHNKYNFM